MDRLFLDANFFIDLVENRRDVGVNQLDSNKIFISTLSIHIVHYIYKYSIPHDKLSRIDLQFTLVSFDTIITTKALNGPTNDFEDNVQLHSAAQSDCDYFLTSDEELLKMAYFGKVRICASLQSI